MSLANFDGVSDIETPQKPITVRSTPLAYDGITIDTNYVPLTSMIAWMEGSNWTVDYFSQILTRDTEPVAQSIEREPIYQQYRRIKGLTLKVDSSLNPQQNGNDRHFQVTGQAYTYPFLVPNPGDMFIADIGDGKAGLFTVERAERLTILKDSAYSIEYMLVKELNATLLADLERKSIETYHYSEENMIGGCGPFIEPDELDRRKRYTKMFKELLSRYLSDFFSLAHYTLLVPDQSRKTYDHFLVKAFLSIIDSRLDNKIRLIKALNVQAEPVMYQDTIWDALTRKDAQKLYGASQQAGVASTIIFRGMPELQSILYTGIQQLVFPKDLPTDVDAQYNKKYKRNVKVSPFEEGKPRRYNLNSAVSQEGRGYIFFQRTEIKDGVEPWRRPPDIHPIVIDDHYVLSSSFYNKASSGYSKLETLVWQYLDGTEFNHNQFEYLLERIFDWDNLERFYYYPIVLILLKANGARP